MSILFDIIREGNKERGISVLKKYVIIVHDEIFTKKMKIGELTKAFDCYYESPVFYADGTWQSFDKALDLFYHHFKHFIRWYAEIVEV